MKRRAAVIVLLLLFVLLLSRNGLMPERFTGIWYAADGKEAYLFQEGIIERLLPEETAVLDGAYSFTRDSITLFVTNAEGLDTVQTLYWSKTEDGEVLKRDPEGDGEPLFSRIKGITAQ